MEIEKIKIVFYIPTLFGGGAERVFVNLANYFVEKNIRVYFLTSYRGGYFNLLNHNIIVEPITKRIFFKNRKLNKIDRILRSILTIYKLIRTIKPNYLITTLDEANILGFIVNFLCGNRTRHIVRQSNIINKNNYSYLKKYFLRKSFQSSFLIISNSPDTKISIEIFVKNLKHKIHIIGNPVFTKFKNGKIDNELIQKKDFILAVNSLRPQKDIQTLINAFSIVKKKYEVNLIILGEGELRSELKQQILKLGLTNSVFLLGFTENPYIYYSKAKLFVLSSISEGFGNVIVEALSFGVPVVCTNCPGGPRFILDNGNYGVLTPIKDSSLMAEAIISVLNGTKKFDSNILINRAKNFSIDNIGEQYLHLIKDDLN